MFKRIISALASCVILVCSKLQELQCQEAFRLPLPNKASIYLLGSEISTSLRFWWQKRYVVYTFPTPVFSWVVLCNKLSTLTISRFVFTSLLIQMLLFI